MNVMRTAALAAALLGLVLGGSPSAAQKDKGAPAAPVAPTVGPPALVSDPAVKKAQVQAAKAEKALKAKPNDPKLKTQTAEAGYQAGHAMEYSELPSRVKYRGALWYYRRTLELNPKHAAAAKEKKQIEDIYKQMGMPVPK